MAVRLQDGPDVIQPADKRQRREVMQVHRINIRRNLHTLFLDTPIHPYSGEN